MEDYHKKAGDQEEKRHSIKAHLSEDPNLQLEKKDVDCQFADASLRAESTFLQKIGFLGRF